MDKNYGSLFPMEFGVKNSQMETRPHPGPLPQEREKRFLSFRTAIALVV